MKYIFVLLLCSSILTGCNETRRDNADEENPKVKKGLALAQLKHWDHAIDQFEDALKDDGSLARPDLELALIYHQQKKNYIRAIYHYERYLEKRPNSQKRPLIRDWIRQAKISFAAEIGQSSGDISDEIIRLTRENNLLRKQLAQTTGSPPSVQNVKTILPDSPSTATQKTIADEPKQEPEPAPPIVTPKTTPVSTEPISRIQTPAPIPKTYKVLPGDTLFKIARTLYGDSGMWKKIYGANMDKMKNENDLKAGQIITIPTLGN